MAKKPRDERPAEIWLTPDCEHYLRSLGIPFYVEPNPCEECGAKPERYVRARQAEPIIRRVLPNAPKQLKKRKAKP